MIEISGLTTDFWPYIRLNLEQGNWDHPKIGLTTGLALYPRAIHPISTVQGTGHQTWIRTRTRTASNALGKSERAFKIEGEKALFARWNNKLDGGCNNANCKYLKNTQVLLQNCGIGAKSPICPRIILIMSSHCHYPHFGAPGQCQSRQILDKVLVFVQNLFLSRHCPLHVQFLTKL